MFFFFLGIRHDQKLYISVQRGQRRSDVMRKICDRFLKIILVSFDGDLFFLIFIADIVHARDHLVDLFIRHFCRKPLVRRMILHDFELLAVLSDLGPVMDKSDQKCQRDSG